MVYLLLGNQMVQLPSLRLQTAKEYQCLTKPQLGILTSSGILTKGTETAMSSQKLTLSVSLSPQLRQLKSLEI